MTFSSIMDGPRGRRLLFELAIDLSRAAHGGGYPDWPAGALLWQAQYQFDPGKDRIVVIRASADDSPGYDADDADGTTLAELATPERLADALADDLSAPLSTEAVREALVESVDSARYWQEPDGRDILANTPEIRRMLARVLTILEASELGSWWSRAIGLDAQFVVEMLPDEPVNASDEGAGTPTRALADTLAEWSRRTTEYEVTLAAEWEARPGRSVSGGWWSAPVFVADSTTGESDAWGGPIGLWAVEDGMGWTSARVARAVTSPNPRVFEITGASDWAELCRRYPIDVTAQRRHNWRLTTERDGAWVMPDWAAVSADYDAVHLTVLGYLSAAGTVIAVGDAASVIAGWNPDETYWLADVVVAQSAVTEWTQTQTEGWRRAD